MSEWISSLQAVKRLRDAGLNAPEATLGLWAEAGFLKSRASWGHFSSVEETTERFFPDEPPVNPDKLSAPTPWPDIPRDFWEFVNVKNGNAEAHYEAGIFAAHVVWDMDIGTTDSTEHIKVYGVSFHSGDLDALLSGVGELQPQLKLETPVPSKRGRKQEVGRWADFGAALALFARYADNSQLQSTNAVHKEVAGLLEAAGRSPLDLRTVKQMVDRARFWIEAEIVAEAFVG